MTHALPKLNGDDTLIAKVAALCRPETYPDAPARIEVVETHMSFVFLTPALAYKLKKPVRYDYLDFSTVALRKIYCDEELRLNRRLAANIYLAVVPLGLDAAGRLRCGARATIVDWLVQMRRLPADRMLDEHIRLGTLGDQALNALAARLATFYRGCRPEAISAADYRAQLIEQIELDRDALRAQATLLDNYTIEATRAAQLRFLASCHALIEQRIAAARIVEGHGDLRPEHVCLLDEPVVFDCLEFNRRFRIVDPIDEIAFLALECERLGAPAVGPTVLAGYATHTGDHPPPALVAFYKSRRASLRARLCIQHIRELDADRWAPWIASAREYLHLARANATRAHC